MMEAKIQPIMTASKTLPSRAEWIEYFTYLDDLRESGETNMWGAGVYLEHSFGVDRGDARKILMTWMDYFDEVDPMDRVDCMLVVERKK